MLPDLESSSASPSETTAEGSPPGRVARDGVRARRPTTWPRVLGRARDSLVGASAVIFVGFGAASLLGFVFLVVAARLLGPAEFGQVAYALAVAELAAVLVTTAPFGLSSFLARYREDRAAAQRYYSSWLLVVAGVLGLSIVATAFVGPAVGITGWLLVGVLCNLLGVTALETYREVARGLDRWVLVSAFYVASNGSQLVAILVAAALGYRSAALFVIIYGLAGVVTLMWITLVSPLRIGLSVRSIGRDQIWEVLKIVQPVLLQSVFFTVWFRADLVIIEHLQSAAATGQYGAAKTLMSALQLAPSAIAFAFLPRASRLPPQRFAFAVRRVLALMVLVIVPTVLVFTLGAGPVVHLLFGPGYDAAAGPLAVLTLGIAAFCFCTVFTDVWLVFRRPIVDTICAGIGMACTLVMAPVLIGQFGILGGAVAFSAGGLVRLIAVAVWTVPALRRASRPPAGEDVDDPRPAVIVGEDPGSGPQAAGYVRFTGQLASRLRANRQVTRLALGRPAASNPAVRLLQSVWLLVRCARDADDTEVQPACDLIYVPRPPFGIAALLRARALKLATTGPAVVVVALQPPDLSGPRERLARLLWPDCLLVRTEADLERYRRLGPRVSRTWRGVELAPAPSDAGRR